MRLGVNIHTKKKNCRRCRAYQDAGGFADGYICELGYKRMVVGIEAPYRHYGVPQEKCPKPLTYQEYFDCLNHWTKSKVGEVIQCP